MAATNKAIRKMRLDYDIDRAIYDAFVKQCQKKVFTPKVVIEQFMKKYGETGQI